MRVSASAAEVYLKNLQPSLSEVTSRTVRFAPGDMLHDCATQLGSSGSRVVTLPVPSPAPPSDGAAPAAIPGGSANGGSVDGDICDGLERSVHAPSAKRPEMDSPRQRSLTCTMMLPSRVR